MAVSGIGFSKIAMDVGVECGVFVKYDAQSVAGGRCEWCETETWKLPSVVTTGDRVASITESRCHHSPNQRA